MSYDAVGATKARRWCVSFDYNGGVHIPECDLWLDPTRARRSAIVSHAQGDHVCHHETAIATPATADLIPERFNYSTSYSAQQFDAPFVQGRSQVTLFRAGHVLGSAQVLVDDGERRLLYSGDLRLRPSIAAGPAEVPCLDMSPPLPPGTMLVAPPQTRRSGAFRALGRCRTAKLTAWAMDPGAREVHTILGFADQGAAELQLRGIAAYSAGRPAQHALPGLAGLA